MIDVLLVDDEVSFLDLAEIYLEKQNEDLDIETTSSPIRALELIKENSYDCVVCDYQMPELNGLDFLEKVRKDLGDGVPFIVFTGKGREEVAMKALNYGADRYLQKGGDPRSQFGVLAQAIKQEVSHKRTKKRARELQSLRNAILEVNQALASGGKLNNVCEKVCDSLVETEGYLEVSIELIEDNELKPIASCGCHERKEWEIEFDKEEIERQRAPSCFKEVIESGEELIIESKNESEYCEGCSYCRYEGDHQSIKVPISSEILEDDINGVFSVCMRCSRDLKSDLQLLRDLSQDLQQGIDKIRIENKLIKTKERYRRLFEEAGDGLAVLSLENGHGEILEANKTFSEMLGCRRDELIGRDIHEFIIEEDKALGKEKHEKKLKKGETVRFKEKKKTDEGEEIWTEVVATPITYNGKKAILGINRNITEDQEIKEMLKKYRDIFKEIPDPVMIKDVRGRYLLVNEAVNEYLGVSKEEIVGKTDKELFGERVGEEMWKKEKEVLNKEKRSTYEETIPTEKGEKTFKTTRIPYYSEQSELKGIISICRDISEQKEVERRFRSLYDSMTEGVAIHKLIEDEDGEPVDYEIIDINPMYEDILDIEKEDAVGELATEVYDSNEPPYFDVYREVAETDEPHRFETYFEPMDKYFNISVFSLGQEKFGTVFSDITEQKRREEKIDKERKKFKEIFNNANDAIYLYGLTDDGEPTEFIEVNEVACNRLGYSKEEFKKLKPTEINPSETKKRTPELLEKLQEDREINFETKHQAKDGTKFSVEVRTHLFEIEDEKRVLSVARDITDRKKTEERENFLHSLLRHDVRNKNQIVEGYLELLKEKLDEENQEFVDRTINACKEGQDIIEKVRTLRKIDEREEIQELKICSVLSEALDENLERAKEKGFEVQENYSEKGSIVKGGPLLKQAFDNLIENAIKHSNGSKIKIRCKERNEEVISTIEDDGKGISDVLKQKVFKQGYKHGETAETGLGLYLVKEIIENYNGDIEVKDSELGGARFDVYLEKSN